jgi:hypothetical protein
VGTVPFVMFGAHWYGAKGAIVGNMLGGIAFGVAAVVVCYRIIGNTPTSRKIEGQSASA